MKTSKVLSQTLKLLETLFLKYHEPIDMNIKLGNNDSLDYTKERVMVANNAQSIFEHIKSLGNDPRHRQRWIWELMQNAQDTDST